jgi:hypothetical protein
MNKYKKGFTPVEVALISINIESYIKNKYWPSSSHNVHCLNELRSTVRYIVCDLTKLELETQDEKYKTDLDKFTCLEEELIPQAEHLKNALIAETLLTQQYEQGSSLKKSLLEIYVPFYDAQFNGEFDPDKTQLTKESLAKWFDEAGEEEIANKFKPIKKVERINLFKKGFTAEQAALIATQLKGYTSLIDTENAINEKLLQEAKLHWQVEKGDYYGGLDDLDSNLTYENIEIARSITEALLEELPLVIDCDIYEQNYIDHMDCVGYEPVAPKHTELLIYKQVNNSNNEIDFEACLIEKESVAKWLFKNGENQLANNIVRNIEQIISDEIQNRGEAQILPNQLEPKKNKDIRTPESSLMDSLGIMAWLLSKKINTFKRGDKPNASEIKKYVENVINDLKLNDDEDNKVKISNLNKDISTALKQLEGRFKL